MTPWRSFVLGSLGLANLNLPKTIPTDFTFSVVPLGALGLRSYL